MPLTRSPPIANPDSSRVGTAPADVESENSVLSTQDGPGSLLPPSTVSGGVGSGGFFVQPVIAITAKSGGELSPLAAVTLEIGDTAEACPLNLAPTASTTAMLALGDALALCVMQRRGFGADDFARVHPGGAIGRQLAPVHEVMRFRVGENLPLIQGHVRLCEAYEQAERTAAAAGLRRPGAVIVVDPAGKLTGILTDGDLRRALIADGPDAWHRPIDTYMTRSPTTLEQTDLVRDAVHLVREHRFDELPVIDGAGLPIGMIDVQDLMALKVIEG